MESRYLFLYGTLLPQHAPREMAAVAARLKRVGEGTVRGLLYDLGEYPGAILTHASRRTIRGTVFRLPSHAALLHELDEYEGFLPDDVQASLFVRRFHPVVLTTGSILRCWIYVYNRDPGGAPLIPSGAWTSRRNP